MKKLILLLYLIVLISFHISGQTPFTLNLKVYLEGPFNGTQMSTDLNPAGYIPLTQPFNVTPWNYNGTESVVVIPNADIVDWVLVELRETPGDASTAYENNIIARKAGFILKNGTVVSTDGINSMQFTNVVSYKLYSVIYHRNHLPVLTGFELSYNTGVYSYDFTTAANKAYGGALAHKELVPGIWGMVSSDGDANSQVNNADKNNVWKPQTGSSGYNGGDFNLNGQVSNFDKTNFWKNNGGKSAQLPASWYCGLPLASMHIEGIVAPVSKSLTYGTVETNLSGSNKCWITRNLGADQQASSSLDATEASSGWYWQFNRKQGYKHDGTTRTPNNPWISSIVENSDWLLSEDPCALLMGNGWRLPTYSELNNSDINGSWTNIYQMYSSPLKLHAAGFLGHTTGYIYSRGSDAYYWSSTQFTGIFGWFLQGTVNAAYMYQYDKAVGFSARCLRELNLAPMIPHDPVPQDGALNQSVNTVLSWICTDPENDPLTFDIYFGTSFPPPQVSAGQSSFTYDPGTLGYNTTCYWKIVAHDDHSHSTEGPVWSFTTIPSVWSCGMSVPVGHTAGNISPVSKTVNYGTVETDLSGSNKCWITQNLGADQQALSATDNTEASAGWYWQFNQKQGYKHDGSIRTPNSAWITSINENSNWTPDNDPCLLLLGSGWRMPTLTEWETTDANGGWNNMDDAYAGILKLHTGGRLSADDGSLDFRGIYGYYWSSTQETSSMAYDLYLGSDGSYIYDAPKTIGFSIRCLKD